MLLRLSKNARLISSRSRIAIYSTLRVGSLVLLSQDAKPVLEGLSLGCDGIETLIDQYGPEVVQLIVSLQEMGIVEPVANAPENDFSEVGLSMEVSAICNLKCRYCFRHFDAHATHPIKLMPIETAMHAIDEYYQICDQKSYIPATVTFTGGEPLLNIDTIKSSVELISQYNKNTVPCMVTNGTLLSNTICDYLLDNNFDIAVSIDLPLKINIEYRYLDSSDQYFQRTISGIKYLSLRNSASLSIQTIICDKTLAFTPKDILEDAMSLGVRRIDLLPEVTAGFLNRPPEIVARYFLDCVRQGIQRGIAVRGPWARCLTFLVKHQKSGCAGRAGRGYHVNTIGQKQSCMRSGRVILGLSNWLGTGNTKSVANDSTCFGCTIYAQCGGACVACGEKKDWICRLNRAIVDISLSEDRLINEFWKEA